MKLRNKKTGEVVNVIIYSPIGNYNIRIWNDKDYLDSTCNDEYLGEYKTLADLNEEWEDYKPAEPLIKDEKIRKAVRAWAEANDFLDEIEAHSLTAVTRFSIGHYDIEFLGYFIYDLEANKTYTLAELCGEEEE